MPDIVDCRRPWWHVSRREREIGRGGAVWSSVIVHLAHVLSRSTYEPARRPTIKNILKRLQETAKDYKEAEEVPSGEPPAVSDKGKSSTSTHKRDVISPRPTEAKPTAALVDSTQRKKGKDRDRDRDRDREKHRHKSKNGDDKEKKSDRKEKKKERKRTSADWAHIWPIANKIYNNI